MMFCKGQYVFVHFLQTIETLSYYYYYYFIIKHYLLCNLSVYTFLSLLKA